MTLSVNTTANTTAVGSTTVAATKPTGATTGDILVAWVSKNTVTAPSGVPSGWALIGAAGGLYHGGFTGGQATAANIGTGWGGWYFKEAGGSEPGTYTWTSTSATWDVTIYRMSGFAGQKPGGVVVTAFAWPAAKVNARASTAITAAQISMCDASIADRYIALYSITQTVAGVVTNFSALSGALTQDSYNAQTGISTLCAHETIDMTSNPFIPQRGCTTDQTAGSTGGYYLLMADPSSTGPQIDKRHIKRQRAP